MQYIIYAIIAIILIIFAIQLIWATILVSPTWIMAISAGYLGSLAVIITIGVFVRFFSEWQSRLVLEEKLWTLRRAPLFKHEGTQTLIHCIGISVMLYLLFQYLRNSIESATDNQESTFLIYSCIIFINTIALAIYICGAYSARNLVPDLVDWLCDYDVKKINELPALLPNVFKKQQQLQELVKAEFGIDWNPKIEQALRQEVTNSPGRWLTQPELLREKTQTALDQIECWHNRLSQSGMLLKQANESWKKAAKIVNQSASTTLVVTMDDLAAILKSKDIQRLGIEGTEGEFDEIIESVKVECDKIAGVAQKVADSGYQEDDSQREDVGQFQLDINLLGVGEDYDLSQLKKAHKFAMFSFHPDNPHNAGDRKSIATQRTQEINAAYERLKNHLS